MEFVCCLFFFSFKGKAWSLCSYEAHMHIWMIHIRMYIYIYTSGQWEMKEWGTELYAREFKKKKRQNTFNIFFCSFLYSLYFTQRGSWTSWNIITSRNFQKESFGSCLWGFLLLSRYFLLSTLWSYSQFAATGAAFPSHTRNNCDRRFGTCVGSCSEPGPTFEEADIWAGTTALVTHSQPWRETAASPPSHCDTPSEQPQSVPAEHLHSRRWKPGEGGKRQLWLSPLFPHKSLNFL